jgi:hypothetical protein
VSIPISSKSGTSKRARQAAKAEVRKILDELWDAQLLAEQFRNAHNEAHRLHALNSANDPARWRDAMKRSATALVTLKTKLAKAVEVLKRTYKDPVAFTELEWDERFWVPPKLLRAQDAMERHRWNLFFRKETELHAARSALVRSKKKAN